MSKEKTLSELSVMFSFQEENNDLSVSEKLKKLFELLENDELTEIEKNAYSKLMKFLLNKSILFEKCLMI